jgi:transposase InsO family protein
MNEMEKYAFLEVIVNQIRYEHPTMAIKSMYELIKPEGMGRDKFTAYCNELGLNQAKRFKPIRTTDSSGVIRFENRLINLSITRVNQVWSSDITYYQIGANVFYLTFVLDNYSRMILGWSVSESLRTENTTLPALKMAIKSRKEVNLKGLIFHSDGGGQYYASTP